MTYETHSDSSPEALGADSGVIQKIPNNPRHPSRAPTWPARYPQFVNKTNDQMGRVTVSDEEHQLSEIDTDESNRLFLNHRPVRGQTITVTDGVLDHVDYENWIIYFSTLPAGAFTVQYLAEPDKYYGEWIDDLQNIVMRLAWVVGATGDEGLANAQMLLNSYPAELQAKLPNAILITGIDRDIWIKSDTDPDAPGGRRHTIGFGNGYDEALADVEVFRVTCSQVGQRCVARITDQTGDLATVGGDLQVSGEARVGDINNPGNPDFDTAEIESYEDTGEAFVAGRVRFRVYGDQVVFGNLYVMGDVIEYQVTVQRNLEVVEESLEVENDLFVRGDTRLGDTSADETSVAGDLEVTGSATLIGVNGAHQVDNDIEFTDGVLRGIQRPTKIDGLDPSYIERVRTFMRPGFYKQNSLNEAPRVGIYEGLVVSGTVQGSANLLKSNYAASNDVAQGHPTGLHHYYRYVDGDYWCVILAGTDVGQVIPVKSYDPATGVWTLARSLSGIAAAGTYFKIFHKRAAPSCFSSSGSTFYSAPSLAQPLVGNCNGVIKVQTGHLSVGIGGAAGDYRVFMSMETDSTEGMDAEPELSYATFDTPPSDRSVLLAEVTKTGGGELNIYPVQPNAQYDSGWRRVNSVASGYDLATATQWAITGIMLGTREQIQRGNVKIFLAPSVTEGGYSSPDVENAFLAPLERDGFWISRLGRNAIDVEIPALPILGLSTLPYWIRLVVE